MALSSSRGKCIAGFQRGILMRQSGHPQVSYANAASSRSGKAVIKLIENATGRRELIRRAQGYNDDLARGQSFWQVMLARYGLSLDVIAGSLSQIPSEGPLVVVANHPFGILDGLVLGHLMSERRGDFRILANSVFREAPEIERALLPVSFEESKAAVRLNLETRARALALLKSGGAVGVFPGGTVSTAARPFGRRPLDPEWRRFTARMIVKSGASVVPVFFEGHNSNLFQVASHLHPTLRVALLLKEFRRRADRPVKVAIGAPIGAATLAGFAEDAQAMMQFLRAETYRLSPDPVDPAARGFEFERRYRN